MRTARTKSYGGGGLPDRDSPLTESPRQRPPDRDPHGQRLPPGQRDPLYKEPSPQQTPLWTETPPRQRPPPPVNRITDRCKNITLPQLRCGR